MADRAKRAAPGALAQKAHTDAVAFILARCAGYQDPLPEHTEQASRVFAGVVAPLLRDIRVLKWLHAEAVWHLEMERLAHATTIYAWEHGEAHIDGGV